eukprot:4410832-Prymnesium_polylepis.1
MFKTVREGASPPTAACRPAAAPAQRRNGRQRKQHAAKSRGTEKKPRDGTKPPLRPTREVEARRGARGPSESPSVVSGE